MRLCFLPSSAFSWTFWAKDEQIHMEIGSYHYIYNVHVLGIKQNPTEYMYVLQLLCCTGGLHFSGCTLTRCIRVWKGNWRVRVDIMGSSDWGVIGQGLLQLRHSGAFESSQIVYLMNI